MNKDAIEKFIIKHDFTDFKWLAPKEYVISFWVRMKCMYGCPIFGQNATCPPNTPSFSDCQQFFTEYEESVIFHFEKQFKDPEKRHKWTAKINNRLYKLEKEIFLSGNEKAFLLFMDTCELCEECSSVREQCKHPKLARPTPEAMCVDVYTTVKKVGYPIQVLKEYSETMNRFLW